MQLSHRRESGVTVIVLAGEVDLAVADRVASYIAAARRGDDDRLVFDMSGVTFIDSPGLRVLIETWRHARAHGGVVHLTALHPHTRPVFDITQMNAYVPIHLTVAEAVRAARRDPRPDGDGQGGQDGGDGQAVRPG